MWSSEASGEALRGVVAAEELEGSTYSRGRAREGGARWHAACDVSVRR